MNSIQLSVTMNEQKTWEFVYMGRQVDFSAEIKKKFPVSREEHTAICHRVSFSLMANGCINALNFYIQNLVNGYGDQEGLANETVYYIMGIIAAVTFDCTQLLASISGEKTEIGDECENELHGLLAFHLKEFFFDPKNVENHLEIYREWLEKIEMCLKCLDENTIDEKLYLTEVYINRILDHLNNESFNLQIGNASWNSSLGNAFDPFGKISFHNGIPALSEQDSAVVSMLLHATKGGGINFDQSMVFLYVCLVNGRQCVYQSRNGQSLEEKPLPYKDKVFYYDYLFKKVREFSSQQ